MLSKEELLKIDVIKSRYPNSKAALLPTLYFFQEKFGYITEESIHEIFKLLNIPKVDIKGVVSFYEMFHEHPKGKYFVQVCTNVSCMLCNSTSLLEEIEKKLGIKCGETTKDNLFTLEEVECLGSCGTAPVISINNIYHENMDEHKINELFDSLK
jgi:NADH-quinone oxidoreductase E subunit